MKGTVVVLAALVQHVLHRSVFKGNQQNKKLKLFLFIGIMLNSYAFTRHNLIGYSIIIAL